ncbi:MAG: hypothetical protein AAF417_11225 [Pseudomonadota bacterium]
MKRTMLCATLTLSAPLFGACASGGDGAGRPTVAEIARDLGCRNDEVAVCIEVNCRPDQFTCVPRDRMRDMMVPEFEPPQGRPPPR